MNLLNYNKKQRCEYEDERMIRRTTVCATGLRLAKCQIGKKRPMNAFNTDE